MAKRQFHLNDKEINERKRYEQQSKRPAELIRLQAVRLYDTGRALSVVVDMIGCSESSVRNWTTDYKRWGVKSLLANYERSSQNARKFTIDQEQDLGEKLKRYRPMDVMPKETGHGNGKFWTVEDVKHMMVEW